MKTSFVFETATCQERQRGIVAMAMNFGDDFMVAGGTTFCGERMSSGRDGAARQAPLSLRSGDGAAVTGRYHEDPHLRPWGLS